MIFLVCSSCRLIITQDVFTNLGEIETNGNIIYSSQEVYFGDIVATPGTLTTP